MYRISNVLWIMVAIATALSLSVADYATAQADSFCQTWEIYKQDQLTKYGEMYNECYNGTCDEPANRDQAIPGPTDPIKYVRLYFNVFCMDDGSNCATSVGTLANQVVELNADYLPLRIQFVYDYRFINSTLYRNYPNVAAMKEAYALNPAQQLNVFITNLGSGSFGTFPWDDVRLPLSNQGGVALTEGHVFPAPYHDDVLAHEIGHCLGLWHTHHGVSEVSYCDVCYERADGQNPDITGDLCSETPPTPTNYYCQDPGGTDGCSATPWGATDYHNFMSYAPIYGGTCWDHFTPQQWGRIHCWTDAVLSSWTFTASVTRHVPSEYPTIQSAINASSNGDTVLVDPGQYVESPDFQGKSIVVTSSGGPLVTTITNNSSNDLLVFDNGETPAAVLEGFTLLGGHIAVWCKNSAPTIRGNVMRDQNIDNWAAVVMSGSTYGSVGTSPAKILDNTIVNPFNGAISTFSTSAPTISNTIIAGANYGIHKHGVGGVAAPILSYNNVWDCPVHYYNCPDTGAGTISADPIFTPDYALYRASPCIDKADPNVALNDPDGTRNDMGGLPVYQVGTGTNYTTIQSAIGAVHNGDVVLVRPGTYVENINFNGKRIIVASRGGADSTTIQAANTGQAVVYFTSAEPKGTELSGFTVTRGGQSGIYCNGSSPKIMDNVIEHNRSTYYNDGGGIDLNFTTGAVVKGNVIRRDTANTYGSGIHMQNCTNDTICYNLLYQNRGVAEIRCLTTKAAIYNNTIDVAGSRGHGIANQLGNDTIDCRNNIVDNAVLDGIYAHNSGYARVEYNDIWDYDRNAFGGAGIVQGTGNIFADPRFWGIPYGEPEGYDLIPFFSPCEDTGDPNPFFADCGGTQNDMGWKPTCENEDMVARRAPVADAGAENLPNRFALESNYPNPFNPSTAIRYSLGTDATVTLEVFNILGQSVRTLVRAELQAAGSYEITWDGTGKSGQPLGSGVYLYRLRADDFVETRKMIMLK
jgi:hypothetical protein